jgi:hypothetical protein
VNASGSRDQPCGWPHLATKGTLAHVGEGEERRDAVEKRELNVGRREAALVERLAAAKKILEAADLRDGEADLRDDASVTLDQAADLAAFVHPKDGDSYGSENPGRRHAALDRGHAKDDRVSAAGDRQALTEEHGADPVEPPES